MTLDHWCCPSVSFCIPHLLYQFPEIRTKGHLLKLNPWQENLLLASFSYYGPPQDPGCRGSSACGLDSCCSSGHRCPAVCLSLEALHCTRTIWVQEVPCNSYNCSLGREQCWTDTTELSSIVCPNPLFLIPKLKALDSCFVLLLFPVSVRQFSKHEKIT